MLSGIVTSDIIGSTSVDSKSRLRLLSDIKSRLFPKLKKKFKTYQRVTKGDAIECYVPNPADTFRIALIMKSFIKGRINTKNGVAGKNEKNVNSRARYFRTYGVRLVAVVDDMTIVDKKKGILEGEAIYKAGRMLSEHHTYDKKRIVIKNSMYFLSHNEKWQGEFEVALMLIDTLLLKSTSRQCEILCERLLGLSENQISSQFRVSQSAVNQGLKGTGWTAIEKAVVRFEKVLKNIRT